MKRPATDAAREKLPFWSVLLRAYASVFLNAGTAARVLLPPLVAYCAISATLSYWQFSFSGGATVMSGSDVAFCLADEAASVVLISSAAVHWHRLLLLGEQPPHSLLATPRLLKTYLVLALVVWIASAIPFYIAAYGWQQWANSSTRSELVERSDDSSKAAPAESSSDQQSGASKVAEPESPIAGLATLALFATGLIALALVACAILSFLPMRLSLTLPAIATGAENNTVARALMLSRGNFWRLYWGNVLTTIPAIAGAVLSMVLIDDTTQRGFVVDATIVTGLLFAGSLVWAAFLSHAYRALTEGERDSAHA